MNLAQQLGELVLLLLGSICAILITIFVVYWAIEGLIKLVDKFEFLNKPVKKNK